MLDILYAMMVSSGCDASAELAYLVGEGESSRFVDMMNEKAAELCDFPLNRSRVNKACSSL